MNVVKKRVNIAVVGIGELGEKAVWSSYALVPENLRNHYDIQNVNLYIEHKKYREQPQMFLPLIKIDNDVMYDIGYEAEIEEAFAGTDVLLVVVDINNDEDYLRLFEYLSKYNISNIKYVQKMCFICDSDNCFRINELKNTFNEVIVANYDSLISCKPVLSILKKL